MYEVNANHQRRQNREFGPPGPNQPSMTVSEQLKESWFIAIIGSILFAIGMCLLFWNEVNKI